MLEDDAPQRVRSCFTSPPKILPNKSKSLSRATNFPYKISFIRHSPNRLHVGDVAPCDNKSDRHKIRQVFIPPSPSVRTLAARQRMLKSKSPLTIFQTSISSKTLYPPPSPITFWVSIGRANQILVEYRVNQSNLG